MIGSLFCGDKLSFVKPFKWINADYQNLNCQDLTVSPHKIKLIGHPEILNDDWRKFHKAGLSYHHNGNVIYIANGPDPEQLLF